jgi:predicted aspartyl protease
MPGSHVIQQAELAFGSLLLLVSIAPAAAAADQGLQPPAIKVTMVGGNLMAVPVHLNGQGPFLFLLDTGGASTMLSPELAARLGLIARVRYAIDTIAGSTTALAGEVERVTLGTYAWRRPEVLWMPLEALRATDPRLQGVIGLDLLSQVDFLLDYPRTSLVLLPASEADGRVAGTRTRLHRMNGRFGVTASAGGRGPGAGSALVLDSGANDVVLFDSEAGRALRHAARPAAGRVEVSSHAGRRVVPLVHLPTLTVGGIALTSVLALDIGNPAGDRPEGGLLPTRLFDRVYFAPTAGYVVLDARLVEASGRATLMTRRN